MDSQTAIRLVHERVFSTKTSEKNPPKPSSHTCYELPKQLQTLHHTAQETLFCLHTLHAVSLMRPPYEPSMRKGRKLLPITISFYQLGRRPAHNIEKQVPFLRLFKSEQQSVDLSALGLDAIACWILGVTLGISSCSCVSEKNQRLSSKPVGGATKLAIDRK